MTTIPASPDPGPAGRLRDPVPHALAGRDRAQRPRPRQRELPLPVARWLEAAWPDGLREVGTLRIEGRVRIRRGRLTLPGQCTMRFDVGAAYVSDITLGVGPLVAIRGLDALVDGTGLTVVGGTASLGPEIDQGTFVALWCQSLLLPTAWDRLPGLFWIARDETRAVAELPFRNGVEHAALEFDPGDDPFPIAFSAARFREVGGPKVGWRIEYGEWTRLDGIALPGRLRVRWADQARPWFELRVDRMATGEPMDEHLMRARRAIASARAGRQGPSAARPPETDDRPVRSGAGTTPDEPEVPVPGRHGARRSA